MLIFSFLFSHEKALEMRPETRGDYNRDSRSSLGNVLCGGFENGLCSERRLRRAGRKAVSRLLTHGS